MPCPGIGIKLPLKVFATAQNHAAKASHRIAHFIGRNGKPFTDGKYIKEAFLCSSEVLFEGLLNKETIKSGIKYIPMSARSVERRVEEEGDNVKAQQTTALKESAVFSVALDEWVNVNDIEKSLQEIVIRLQERSSAV